MREPLGAAAVSGVQTVELMPCHTEEKSLLPEKTPMEGKGK